jgi:hypothetical protein
MVAVVDRRSKGEDEVEVVNEEVDEAVEGSGVAVEAGEGAGGTPAGSATPTFSSTTSSMTRVDDDP